MIAELREMLKLDDLKLNYKVQIADFDGESFTFCIPKTDDNEKDLLEKITEKMKSYQESDDEYDGYLEVYDKPDKVFIYYDTGNVDDPLDALHGLLYAMNEVQGIQSVLINEME